jgi:hypothetical protein
MHLELLFHVLEVSFQLLPLGESVGSLFPLVLQLRFQVPQLFQEATPLLLSLLLLSLKHMPQSASSTVALWVTTTCEHTFLWQTLT